MRTQTMVQLTEDLLRRLDDRADRDGMSRSKVIRDAIVAYLAADEHEQAVVAFIQAYREIPDDAAEMATAEANARAMVADEQW